MAKYKTLVDFSFKNLGPNEIANYYNDADSSIRFFYASSSASKFFGYTNAELLTEMEARLAELDATCAFTLLADLEATFRIDYLQRCYQKRKDPVSKIFREIYKKKGSSSSLERDILSTWKAYMPRSKSIVGDIVGAFHYRDWIAHGRYWTPSLGRKYDFVTIFQIDAAARSSFSFLSA